MLLDCGLFQGLKALRRGTGRPREPEAAAALREAVVGTLGWRAEVARDGQRVTV